MPDSPTLIKFQTFPKYTQQMEGLFPKFCALLSAEVSMTYLNLCLKVSFREHKQSKTSLNQKIMTKRFI